MNNITLGPNTQLQPTENGILKTDKKFRPTLSASPERRHSPVPEQSSSHVSPIRRSGSPVRRQQIQEIENKYRNMKRKSGEMVDSPKKKPKSVQFNEEVQYFDVQAKDNSTKPENNGRTGKHISDENLINPENHSSDSPGPTLGEVLLDIQTSQKQLKDEIKEIKEGQREILRCIETIMKKIT